MAMGPEWVSASDLRNFCLDETLLDWLKLYGRDHDFTPDDELPGFDSQTDFTTFIFAKGIEFERAVLRCLTSRGFDWIDLSRDREQRREDAWYSDTIEALRSGTPLIYQGALRHNLSQTFGFPDLLVRSDYLGRLVDEQPLTGDDEAATPAPLLELPYHYRVVDIKFSTLHLLKGGEIGDAEKWRSRKAQLFVYNRALAAIQGMTPPTAYFLGRTWDQTVNKEKLRGKGCLDLLGPADMVAPDLEALVEAASAWVRRVRTEGSAWQVLPMPTVLELRPGKVGTQDAPWTQAKKRIAHELKDPILLPQVRTVDRNAAARDGIIRFNDERASAATLGVSGPTYAPRVDSVIRMSRCEGGPRIHPPQIARDRTAWDGGRPLDFYVDFETVTGIDDDFSKMPAVGGQPLIFMIGCGHIEDGEWRFECFIADSLEEPEEAKIIRKWFEHMTVVSGRFPGGSDPPRVFHWSHAEKSFLSEAYNSAQARHPGNDWPSPNWYDFLTQVMKAEPVIVKDALMFGLKPTAKAMFDHGFIEEQWTDGVGGGMDAMVGAWRCDAEAKRLGVPMHELPLMQSIAKYNETDCKVMQEIIAYLRENH